MNWKSLTRISVTTAACAVALVGVGAGAASAGEVTGNGKLKTIEAQSICAYSGQNDAFHGQDPHAEPGDELIRVQSYGQIRRSGEQVPAFLHPGSACNGHTGFLATGP